MVRILTYSLIVFGIICTTACPNPSYTEIITGNDVGRPQLKGSGYIISFFSINHLYYNQQKIILFDMEVSNTSKDTLIMVCSKPVIYSKTDTFSWLKPDRSFKHFYFYEDLKDTVMLAPHGYARAYMLLAGKKNYSRKLYTKSNKEDTLYLKLNLFDKDTLQVPMRNHFRGAAWNRY